LIEFIQGRYRDDSASWSEQEVFRRLGNGIFWQEGRGQAGRKEAGTFEEGRAEEIGEKGKEVAICW